jgi:hypothetical protein
VIMEIAEIPTLRNRVYGVFTFPEGASMVVFSSLRSLLSLFGSSHSLVSAVPGPEAIRIEDGKDAKRRIKMQEN